MSSNDQTPPGYGDIKLLVASVVDIDSFPATGTALATHPALLAPLADLALAELLTETRNDGDPDRGELIRQFRAFLGRCRRDGLGAVFPANNSAIDPQVVAVIADDMNAADVAEAAYDDLGDPGALTPAATAWRRVLTHPSVASAYPGLRAALSNNSGQLLLRRHWAVGSEDDMDAAEDAFRQAVALTPVRSGLRAGRLGNLGLVRRERYRRSGDVRQLEHAVETFKLALEAVRDSSALPTALVNLALVMQDRYLALHDIRDFEHAVRCAEQAHEIDTSPGPTVMLADLQRQRFATSGARSDLESAVRLLREAVSATSATSPDRPRRLVDLGIALLDRHAEDSDPDDLTAAIELFTAAVAMMWPTSPDLPPALVHLALGQLRSYESTGSLDDLVLAVHGLRRATDRDFETTDATAWTANLAAALHELARRTGRIEEVDEAIALYEAVVRTQTTSADQFSIVNNLGNALRDRYRCTGDSRDLERAVDVLGDAVELAPPRSAHFTTLLANLGAARLDHFAATGSVNDLELALNELTAAAELTGLSSLDRPRRLFALALAARTRYEVTGDEMNLRTADGAFRKACELGQVADLPATLTAAEEWGVWAAERKWWPDSTIAFDAALASLFGLIRVQLTREHKETWLRESIALPARTAYANVMLQRRRVAVLALEMGRAITLSEALERHRLDLTMLATEHVDLASRFTRAANRLRRSDLPTLQPFQ